MFAQQKSDRRSARRIPFQRFIDGATQRRRAIQVQQFEQLRCLTARRFSLCEGQVEQAFCSPARPVRDDRRESRRNALRFVFSNAC